MVASESYPFIKTGGLADVIGSLSRNLVRQGQDVTVILPLYKKIKDAFLESITRGKSMNVLYDEESYHIRLYTYTYRKVKYFFVESHDFFDYDQVYGLPNDVDRFAFFNKVVVELLLDLDPFDIVHIHDWHTSLIPILIDNSPYKGLKTLLTLHNIDYQGVGSSDVIKKLGIKEFIFREPTINCLNIGINTASKLSTVSPTYKEELKYDYYGKNLTYSLLKRERDFYGILNGISSTINPETDKLLYCNYNSNNRDCKLKNKQYLQQIMGLKQDPNTMVLGMVTRIVEQKGFDLILYSFDELMQHYDLQFVLLGTGDKEYERRLQELESRYPDRIKLNLGYDATVPNYIYAGADAFLMPSRFEPCGLGQMIALKYGTLPIVRNTGGLADTVSSYDQITKKGNGFKFFNYDSNALKDTIIQAYNVYKNEKDVWELLQKRAMRTDNSLKRMAQRYIELYRAITENF
jgi:starch synthase